MVMTRSTAALLVVGAAAILVFAVAGRGTDDTSPKPPSTEDDIRELKRRLDKVETERAELSKRADRAESALKKARQEFSNGLKDANKRIGDGTRKAALDRVPIGAMIPYLGTDDTLPEGYVFADGKARWPESDWVPKHLRGERVPDMTRQLVGGAGKQSDVGLVFDKGRVPLPTMKVNAAKFEVETKQERLGKNGFVLQWTNPGGWHIEQPDPEKKPMPVLHIKMYKDGYWTTMQTHKAFSTAPTGKLKGEHEIKDLKSKPLNSPESNPRHVMCRWIIRVR